MSLLAMVIFVLFPMSASALETDNYLSWQVELQDSSPIINDFMLEKINATLPLQQGKSCLQVTDAIAKNFASFLVHDDPISQYLLTRLNSDEMYPATIHHVPSSIYRDPFRFYIPQFGLAPNIQVGGFYFGMDKLSHFAATGKHYFDTYMRTLRQGKSQHEAFTAAVAYGLKEENTVYGYWASGVFSYADLEADYQGLRFYQALCQNDLEQSPDGSWRLKSNPDIRDYVNAHWDETFNPNYLLVGNWNKVKKFIQQDYCSLRNSVRIQERFAAYQRSPISQSVEYLKTLRETTNRWVPNPLLDQSVEKLCR